MNSSRVHLERFLERAANGVGEGERVLDAGAGDCRYAPLFAHAEYESCDFAQVEKAYGQLTYTCDITSIPVEDGRYAAVVCSQVIAHLPDPSAALKELHRVLQPGGALWLSCPLFFHENEHPYDYWRFTQFGIRHLMEESGFRIESLDWLEGYGGTLSYQLGVAYKSLGGLGPGAFGGGALGVIAAAATVLARPMLAGLHLLYGKCDTKHKILHRGQNKNYAVVARRRQARETA